MKTIKIKPIKIHFNLDIDNDMIYDNKDCMPFDKRYQDIKKVSLGTNAFFILEFLKYIPDGRAHFKDIVQTCNRYPSPTMAFANTLADLVESKLLKKVSRGIYEITPMGVAAYETARNRLAWKMPENADFSTDDRIVSKYMYMPAEMIPKSIQPTKIVRTGTRKYNVLCLLATDGDTAFNVIDKRFFCGFSNMDVSATLRSLEHAGLIYRKKKGIYSITEKGKEVLDIIKTNGVWKEL